MLFSFGSGYSYITLNKDYLIENKDRIIEFIKTTLENKEYVIPPDSTSLSAFELERTIYGKEIKVHEDFKSEWAELQNKYRYWHLPQ
jgi:hypothetical protein